jgi:hypothetical protein
MSVEAKRHHVVPVCRIFRGNPITVSVDVFLGLTRQTLDTGEFKDEALAYNVTVISGPRFNFISWKKVDLGEKSGKVW